MAPAAGHDPASPSAAGGPLVDLTSVLTGLYERAEAHREAAVTLDELAAGQRRTADHLEALAFVLSGGYR